jgi:hypothetical protein
MYDIFGAVSEMERLLLLDFSASSQADQPPTGSDNPAPQAPSPAGPAAGGDFLPQSASTPPSPSPQPQPPTSLAAQLPPCFFTLHASFPSVEHFSFTAASRPHCPRELQGLFAEVHSLCLYSRLFAAYARLLLLSSTEYDLQTLSRGLAAFTLADNLAAAAARCQPRPTVELPSTSLGIGLSLGRRGLFHGHRPAHSSSPFEAVDLLSQGFANDFDDGFDAQAIDTRRLRPSIAAVNKGTCIPFSPPHFARCLLRAAIDLSAGRDPALALQPQSMFALPFPRSVISAPPVRSTTPPSSRGRGTGESQPAFSVDAPSLVAKLVRQPSHPIFSDIGAVVSALVQRGVGLAVAVNPEFFSAFVAPDRVSSPPAAAATHAAMAIAVLTLGRSAETIEQIQLAARTRAQQSDHVAATNSVDILPDFFCLAPLSNTHERRAASRAVDAARAQVMEYCSNPLVCDAAIMGLASFVGDLQVARQTLLPALGRARYPVPTTDLHAARFVAERQILPILLQSFDEANVVAVPAVARLLSEPGQPALDKQADAAVDANAAVRLACPECRVLDAGSLPETLAANRLLVQRTETSLHRAQKETERLQAEVRSKQRAAASDRDSRMW